MIFGFDDDKNLKAVAAAESATDSGWITLKAAGTYTGNSSGTKFTVDQPIQYRKVGNEVFIRGNFDSIVLPSNTIAASVEVGNLPSAYRPLSYPVSYLIRVQGANYRTSTSELDYVATYVIVYASGAVSLSVTLPYTSSEYYGKTINTRNSFCVSYVI